MIDYKKLLKKYMEHVGNQEGIYFLGESAYGVFTDEEMSALEELVSTE